MERIIRIIVFLLFYGIIGIGFYISKNAGFSLSLAWAAICHLACLGLLDDRKTNAKKLEIFADKVETLMSFYENKKRELEDEKDLRKRLGDSNRELRAQVQDLLTTRRK